MSGTGANIGTDRALLPVKDAFARIGYGRNLIHTNHRYVGWFSPGTPEHTVSLGVFGQEPLDHRSACFGVQLAAPDRSSDVLAKELRSFGAPQIFIVRNGRCERWVMTEREPAFREPIETRDLPNAIIQNQADWNPDKIIRAKLGFARPSPVQLDFVDIGLLPALEREAQKKIDALLKRVLHGVEEYQQVHGLPLDTSAVFRIVFSLLAAKLLKDREVRTGVDIDFGNPATALQAVSNHYGPSLIPTSRTLPRDCLRSISNEIGRSFPLANISVDTLTYIYENTFVSPENRKEYGIHSTPSYVADYVLGQIPFEDIADRAAWHTVDPMCGHGIFLIAAMRRMRELLPKELTGKQRHKFFVDHLHGVDIDEFSIEVARLCLMLADFPEPDGWDLTRADAFSGNNLNESARRSTILVANPPFELHKEIKPTLPKPLLFLSRILPHLQADSMIGVVMPRALLYGDKYGAVRNTLMKDFRILSITTLPDRIFTHSDAETALLVAKKQSGRKTAVVLYREVRDADKLKFRLRSEVSREETVPQAHFEKEKGGALVLPALHEVWGRLQHNETLKAVATVRTCLRYKEGVPLDSIVQPKPFPESTPGFYKISDGFMQFTGGRHVFMSTKKDLIRDEGEVLQYDWKRPKVILPASRTSRGHWRFAAAIDTKGRLLNRSFYAVWPTTEGIDVRVLAAVLNAPLAQAFAYCNQTERNILINQYEAIPIPPIGVLVEHSALIGALVSRYLEEVEKGAENAVSTLMRIDAEVMRLYRLPPGLERQVLDLFWGEPRRVDVPFNGYIPPEFESWVPLHVFMSDKFRESTVESIMRRIPKIEDGEFIDYLKKLGTE